MILINGILTFRKGFGSEALGGEALACEDLSSHPLGGEGLSCEGLSCDPLGFRGLTLEFKHKKTSNK